MKFNSILLATLALVPCVASASIADQLIALENSRIAITNAIVQKGGVASGALTNCAAEIMALPSGGVETIPLSVISNGIYAAAEETAYSNVTVAVNDIWPRPRVGDGKTHLWYYFPPGLKAYLQFSAGYISNGHTFTVDWGDGTTDILAATATLVTRTISHTYSTGGYHEVVISGYDSMKLLSYVCLGQGETVASSWGSLRQIECARAVPDITGSFRFGYQLITLDAQTNITTLGESTFQGCLSLTSVGDLSSCMSIGKNAFLYCSSLASVGDLSACTSIGADAFCGCTSLASVGDLSACTTIGAEAFYNCASLTPIIDLTALTSIKKMAFCGCSSLKSINAPSVTAIDDAAFQGCTSITNIDFPSCTTIGGRVLQDSLNLKSVNLPVCVNIGEDYDRTFSTCGLLRIYAPCCTNLQSESFTGSSYCTNAYFGTLVKVGSNAVGFLGYMNDTVVGAERARIFVGNTMSSLRSLSNFPWNANKGYPSRMYDVARSSTTFYCADGRLVWNGSNAYIDTPYSSTDDLPNPGDNHYVYEVGGDQYRWSDENSQYENIQ